MSPSPASQALLTQYRELAERFAAQPDMSLAAMRDMFESLSERQSEPTDVTYEEVAAGNGRALWVRPFNAVEGRVILYFHGGGYIAHTMSTSRKLIAHLAKATRASALIPDYRLAPEHPFPAQVEDAAAAYRWLLDNDVAPSSIAFAGESAGGNLALAAVVKAQLDDLPLPGAVVGFSPWLDLLGETGTFDTNSDAFLSRTVSTLMAGMFLGESGSSSDPLANPLYADPAGFPPIFITAGGDESLEDAVRLFADNAKTHGVPVELDVVPDMQHAFQWMAGRAPEADDSIARAGLWLQNHLDTAFSSPRTQEYEK